MSKTFCNKCGAKLKPDASFCTNCGSVINKNEEIIISSRANDNSQKDKTGKGLGKILLIIAFSSAVALTIFYLSSNILKQDRSIDDNVKNQVTTIEDSKSESINLNIVSVNFTTLSSAGELIPVICRYSTAKKDSTIIWTIENIGNASQIVNITAEIPGWSNLSEKTIELPSNKTVRIPLNLTYKREFYKNNEITDAQINYKLTMNDKVIWADTKAITIASKGTMLWSAKRNFDLSSLIAAFVNPHDPKVEEIISLAKENTKSRSLIGYQRSDNDEQEKETYYQAKAIFGALGEYGLSYVNSPVDFSKGFTQRVRVPYESIHQKSANCIDGAVLYASLFENLGMEPAILLGPGHAFVAVRCWSGSNKWVFIETTMTSQKPKQYGFFEWLSGEQPDDPFKRACNEGWATFCKWRDNKTLTMIDIKECREKGILPAFTE